MGMLLMGLNRDHKDIIRTWLTSRSAWPASHRPQTFLSELNVENRVKAAKLEHQPDIALRRAQDKFHIALCGVISCKKQHPQTRGIDPAVTTREGFRR